MKEYSQAVAVFREALRLAPDLAPLHHNLGLGLHRQGNLADAVLSYEKALAIDPGYKEPLQNMGAALRDLGKVQAAVGCYQKLMELVPGDESVQFMVDSLTGNNRVDGHVKLSQKWSFQIEPL